MVLLHYVVQSENVVPEAEAQLPGEQLYVLLSGVSVTLRLAPYTEPAGDLCDMEGYRVVTLFR